MQYTTRNPSVSSLLLDYFLDCFLNLAGSPIGANAQVKLYTAGPTAPNPLAVPADFTEATFNGYADTTIASQAGPVNNPSANGRSMMNACSYIAGTGIVAPGQTVLGYYVVDSAGTSLFFFEAFPVPLNFVLPGDFLDLNLLTAFMSSLDV